MNRKKAVTISGIIFFSILFFAILSFVYWCVLKNPIEASILRKNGPQNEPSIWISEDNELYIINDSSQHSSFLHAYILKDNVWEHCKLEQESYAPILSLKSDRGLIFKTKGEIKNHKLILSKIDFHTIGVFPEWKELILIKYPYEEKINNLPFEQIPEE